MSDSSKSDHWKCPKCNTRFRKTDDPSAGNISLFFDNTPDVLTNCPQCGHYISVRGLINGKYDTLSSTDAIVGGGLVFGLGGSVVTYLFDGGGLLGAVIGAAAGSLIGLLIRSKAIVDPLESMPTHKRADAFVEHGIVRFDSDDFDGAMKSFSKAIRLCPDHENAYLCRAKVHNHLKDYREAEQDASKVIGVNPTSALAYDIRACALFYQGNQKGSMVDFAEALRLDPNFAMAYLNRGNANYELGRFDEALSDYKNALDHNLPSQWVGPTMERMKDVSQEMRWVTSSAKRLLIHASGQIDYKDIGKLSLRPDALYLGDEVYPYEEIVEVKVPKVMIMEPGFAPSDPPKSQFFTHHFEPGEGVLNILRKCKEETRPQRITLLVKNPESIMEEIQKARKNASR